jgi:hypothetical protein
LHFECVQFLISKFRRVEGIVAQTIIVEEGVKGFRSGLAQPEVQPILYEVIYPVLLHD